MVTIELVYVSADGLAFNVTMDLEEKATVSQALEASGIHQKHPETQGLTAGIYSRPVSLDHILKDGDRLEVYRPLSCDPKEKRRQRVKYNSDKSRKYSRHDRSF